jgi:hypothetical protein
MIIDLLKCLVLTLVIVGTATWFGMCIAKVIENRKN